MANNIAPQDLTKWTQQLLTVARIIGTATISWAGVSGCWKIGNWTFRRRRLKSRRCNPKRYLFRHKSPRSYAKMLQSSKESLLRLKTFLSPDLDYPRLRTHQRYSSHAHPVWRLSHDWRPAQPQDWGWGERPRGPKDQELNHFPFLWHVRTKLTGQNLFQEDPDGRLANSRHTATKERTCNYPKSGMVQDIPLN